MFFPARRDADVDEHRADIAHRFVPACVQVSGSSPVQLRSEGSSSPGYSNVGGRARAALSLSYRAWGPFLR